MSSAVNHRARSRRSYAKHASAVGNMARTARKYEIGKYGAPDAGLIYRLQAFKRKVLESCKRSPEEA